MTKKIYFSNLEFINFLKVKIVELLLNLYHCYFNIYIRLLSFWNMINNLRPQYVSIILRGTYLDRLLTFLAFCIQAVALYKSVAERGPWSSLSRWALEAYMKGDVGKAFILYSRMSELGYEVAQSNAAWILDKYGKRSMCMGVSGFCTDKERKERAHALWWRASKQGNDYAALLVGDAYYYGRVCSTNFEC